MAEAGVLGGRKASDRKAEDTLAEAARLAGFNLVASEQGFLAQLPQLLEQVLEV